MVGCRHVNSPGNPWDRLNVVEGMRSHALRFLVSSLLVATAACGERSSSNETDGSAQERSAASYDGTWKLVEGRGPQGVVPIIGGYRITLTIDGDSAAGTAACNQYGGDAAIDEGSFDLLRDGINEMGCRSDLSESEAAYMMALQAADTIARDDDILILTGEETELRFEIVPPLPTADLIDKPWELESLIFGTGGKRRVAATAPARLLLDGDGTISGTTGCRELYGDWIEDGDEIAFPTFGAEGNCPEELRDQDSHVVTVLGDGFAPTVEGGRLTLLDRGGLGLEYRAAPS
jgi:heat shock protein HslJ